MADETQTKHVLNSGRGVRYVHAVGDGGGIKTMTINPGQEITAEFTKGEIASMATQPDLQVRDQSGGDPAPKADKGKKTGIDDKLPKGAADKP